MIQDRTCQTLACGRVFQGGPRAYYCHECRADRKRIQQANHKRRKRAGQTRILGSLDECERCGKPYTVEAGPQRFCPECQPIHMLQYDRETSIMVYHANKDRINPIRNERRRIGTKKCSWCGQEFDVDGKPNITCSDECASHHRNKLMRRRYHLKRGSSETKLCIICEGEFKPADRSVTCSAECRKQHKNNIARNAYHRKKGKTTK